MITRATLQPLDPPSTALPQLEPRNARRDTVPSARQQQEPNAWCSAAELGFKVPLSSSRLMPSKAKGMLPNQVGS